MPSFIPVGNENVVWFVSIFVFCFMCWPFSSWKPLTKVGKLIEIFKIWGYYMQLNAPCIVGCCSFNQISTNKNQNNFILNCSIGSSTQTNKTHKRWCTLYKFNDKMINWITYHLEHLIIHYTDDLSSSFECVNQEAFRWHIKAWQVVSLVTFIKDKLFNSL